MPLIMESSVTTGRRGSLPHTPDCTFNTSSQPAHVANDHVRGATAPEAARARTAQDRAQKTDPLHSTHVRSTASQRSTPTTTERTRCRVRWRCTAAFRCPRACRGKTRTCSVVRKHTEDAGVNTRRKDDARLQNEAQETLSCALESASPRPGSEEDRGDRPAARQRDACAPRPLHSHQDQELSEDRRSLNQVNHDVQRPDQLNKRDEQRAIRAPFSLTKLSARSNALCSACVRPWFTACAVDVRAR